MPWACEAPLLGGVEVDAAGVSGTGAVADPGGAAAAVADESRAFVAEDEAAVEAAVDAVEVGLTLEDGAAGFLIPQTASVSKSAGRGMFQAAHSVVCLSMESMEPH